MKYVLGILAVLVLCQNFTEIARAESMKTSIETATFAGGCFWGMEKLFGEMDGVVSTRVGYTGGRVSDPTYEMVCTGKTGHAESIEITFDPSKITYAKLLETFFSTHDPTTPNQQGNDIGTQYRSAIFYYDSIQERLAQQTIERPAKSKVFKGRIVTEVKPAAEFYPAEEYHQKYLKKNPNGTCVIHTQSRQIAEVLKGLN